MSAPAYFFPKDDIRFAYKLAGGAMMDMGTYAVSTLRQIFRSMPEECVSATPRPMPKGRDQQCDQAMRASWRFPGGGKADIDVDLAKSRWGLPAIDVPACIVKHKEVPVTEKDVKIVLNNGQTHTRTRTVTYWNFVMPGIWHRIDVVDEHFVREEVSRKVAKKWTVKESKKAYAWGELKEEGKVRVGEEYWSSYRYMLEEFVNKINGKQGSGVWVDGQESINGMVMIDQAYEKCGLPPRPTSTFE